MRIGRNTLYALAVLALPILVAFFGISVGGAIALVAVVLLWRWAITLTGLVAPQPGPDLVLETISASHFVEKVRWALDKLGVEYQERPNVGVLGVFFAGRTVPVLHVKTGAVTTSIGDSSAILRYLWGAYAGQLPERAAFLEPQDDALRLEAQFDRYGTWMQRWIYYHLLPQRRIMLHAWGFNDPRLPAWQRYAAWTLYPLLRILMTRAFRIGDEAHVRNLAKIDQLLNDCEENLARDDRSLLDGGNRSYVDFAFAALSGLWVMPAGYGAGNAEAVRLPIDDFPARMTGEISSWRDRYPKVTEFVERLYREERLA